MMNFIYLEGLQVGLRLDKYVWQWVVRNSDYDIETQRGLGVVSYGDGGDLRRGQGWHRGGEGSGGVFFLLSADFFLGGTTLLNFLFAFLLQLQQFDVLLR